jgi:hypothetical protein
MSNPVDRPTHYTVGEIECIEYLRDNMPDTAFAGYLEGNVKKYLHRWRYKNNRVEDLAKAGWYLDYLQQITKEMYDDYDNLNPRRKKD